MTILTAFAAAALAITSSAPALADSSARVSTRDLDLSTAQGQHVLDLRIARAADTLCQDANSRLSAQVRREVRQCRATAISTARANIASTVRLVAK